MSDQFEVLFGENAGYVAELFSLYKVNPELVGSEWSQVFSAFAPVGTAGTQSSSINVPSSINGVNKSTSINGSTSTNGVNSPVTSGKDITDKVSTDKAYADEVYTSIAPRVTNYLMACRNFGHFKAKINPLHLGIVPSPSRESLERKHYSFSESDLSAVIFCEGFAKDKPLSVRDILDRIDSTYFGSVGFEYWHLSEDEERLWLCDRIENGSWKPAQEDPETRKRRLTDLIRAEQFEAGLHRKYVGAKRFSLEGGETLIPMLATLFDNAGKHGITDAVLGMAHRGRLNVLVNICGKRLGEIFAEFEDVTMASSVGAGDVKYHNGFEGVVTTNLGHSLGVRLASNPSHLEFVTPVVMGIARALQDERYRENRNCVIPVVLHGDAAFIGQGIVTETLNFARVRGYTCGGALHIVINNQIGFTTTPDEARSSVYCTDFAKATDIPVFHVNAEDVDASCAVIELALEYRQKFHKDVVIDLYCFRKYGHNEGDDPTFTQPLLYSGIKAKKSIPTQYAETLHDSGIIDQSYAQQVTQDYIQKFDIVHRDTAEKVTGGACPTRGRLGRRNLSTSISAEDIARIAEMLISYPSDFRPHPKLERLLKKRIEVMFLEGKGVVEWGLAEALAFGSLILCGVSVRLVGQDAIRGTFSHRHLGLDHYPLDLSENQQIQYFPLNSLAQAGASTLTDMRPALFEVFNTTLSEAGVMGFEYGYSVTAFNRLVLWEGQFGDFANGAQVIIDQFLSSSESKWNELCGLVLLLPHGCEGQGPEHTSARLERFLQLCAEGNMTVVYPTTSSQYFHLLRRQAFAEVKRPLVVMTPKSLLRSSEAMSELSAFKAGTFEPIIVKHIGENPQTLFLCTGKIYFDIYRAIEDLGTGSATIVRIEQLYPFPELELQELFGNLKPKRICWVQEEHQNQGAWWFVERKMRELGVMPEVLQLHYIGRSESASTATGSPKYHYKEHKAILDSVVAEINVSC